MEEWPLLGLAKIKFVSVHATKAYRGSRGIAPLIRNLGARWRQVFSFTSRSIYLQKKNYVSIKQEVQPVWTFLCFSAQAHAISKVCSSLEKVVAPIV